MENISPTYWGNKYWYMIYCAIAVYPSTPSPEQIKNIMGFFESLKTMLPCASCRESYQKFSLESDTNIKDLNNFKNRGNLIKMIYALKKKVDSKVGKEYYLTMSYLTFKMNNMICKDNPNEFNANTINECAFIPENLENKVNDYVYKNKQYIIDYDSKNTKNIIKKLKLFLQNPDVNSKHYLLWIERNNKCRDLMDKIEKNMCEKKYDTNKSFNVDKKLYVQLFYLGATNLSSDELSYLIS